jgi:hypothetical protein
MYEILAKYFSAKDQPSQTEFARLIKSCDEDGNTADQLEALAYLQSFSVESGDRAALYIDHREAFTTGLFMAYTTWNTARLDDRFNCKQ